MLQILAPVIAVQGLLMGLLVYTHWFYCRQIAHLVDRLMSRDIGDYQRAVKPGPPKIIVKSEPPLEDFGRMA